LGKKRVITKSAESTEEKEGGRVPARHVKIAHKLARGFVYIQATYNNTLITVTDEEGNAVAWSTAGALGFSGAKKATPFAAARVAENVAEKSKKIGIQDIKVFVRGVGSGRDSAIRALANHGLNIVSIKDITPLPHNGPRSKKARRV